MSKHSHRTIRGMRIIHEDDDLIVIDKAAGVLSQATRCGASSSFSCHSFFPASRSFPMYQFFA